MTTALEGGEWSASRPGHSSPPPRNDLVPIIQEDGWTPGPVWTCAENFSLTGIRSPERPAYQSSIQNNKYHLSHKHSCISWWWVHSRPKNVEKNKHTKKKCAPIWLYLQDYTEMHGQQNIKYRVEFSRQGNTITCFCAIGNINIYFWSNGVKLFRNICWNYTTEKDLLKACCISPHTNIMSYGTVRMYIALIESHVISCHFWDTFTVNSSIIWSVIKCNNSQVFYWTHLLSNLLIFEVSLAVKTVKYSLGHIYCQIFYYLKCH
jgi:hypothetical protein